MDAFFLNYSNSTFGSRLEKNWCFKDVNEIFKELNDKDIL